MGESGLINFILTELEHRNARGYLLFILIFNDSYYLELSSTLSSIVTLSIGKIDLDDSLTSTFINSPTSRASEI